MDLTTIVNSMKAYNLLLANPTLLVDKFKQGSYFYFDLPTYASGSGTMHAYPGIHNGKLKFFLIPEDYDTHGTEHIENYVTVCAVERNLQGNRIPDLMAAALVSNWDTNYETWIPSQCATVDGMFKAFSIPMSDFEVINTRVNLALKPAPTAVTSNTADIVVTNVESTATYYDDFAQPVPPYPTPSALTSGFYLLSLV